MTSQPLKQVHFSNGIKNCDYVRLAFEVICSYSISLITRYVLYCMPFYMNYFLRVL